MLETKIEMEKKRCFYLAFLVLLFAVCIAYSPSLKVPFYLDDMDSIVSNAYIQADAFSPLIQGSLHPRFVGYSTIWLNYQLSELDPTGYHLGNIVIHLFNTILVFLLASTLLTYFANNTREQEQHSGFFWALAVAALWALHPLNSQPVIYIVQRLSSIVAFFMLFTALSYINLRTSKSPKCRFMWGMLFLTSTVLGVFSKQNFITIFVFLYFWELYTASDQVKKTIVKFTVLMVVMLAFIGPLTKDFWMTLDTLSRDVNATSRLYYFYTQMLVLWEYFLRFLVPVNLQLNIDVKLKESFEPIVALAMSAHIVTIALAYKVRPTIPLLFVGITLFYTSHLVESFIIPIKDLAFEHRTYVGNIGLVLCVVSLMRFFYEKFGSANKKIILCSMMAVVLALGSVKIFMRSLQWQDPLSFYANEVKLAPEHHRTNGAYGNELLKIGNFAEAEKYLKKGINISAQKGTMTAGALNSYMMLMYQQERYQEAAPLVMVALKYIQQPVPRSMLLSNLAVGYIYMGFCDFALGLLNQALVLNSANAEARTNKAYCEQQLLGQ